MGLRPGREFGAADTNRRTGVVRLGAELAAAASSRREIRDRRRLPPSQIDWSAVARDNISFAYIKASEGGDFTDRNFTANWQGAEAVGLDRGAYHFFTLCTPGHVQAEHFLDVVQPDPRALPPAVDLELAGNCSGRPTVGTVDAELDRFLERIAAAWRRPVVLYVGDDWNRRYPTRTRSEHPLWHRRILRRPGIDRWVIWQVHGIANVEGISGPVDLNIMRSSF